MQADENFLDTIEKALNKLSRERSHDGSSLKVEKLTSAGQLVKQMKIEKGSE